MEPKRMTEKEYRRWFSWARENVFPDCPEYEFALLDGLIVIIDLDLEQVNADNEEGSAADDEEVTMPSEEAVYHVFNSAG